MPENILPITLETLTPIWTGGVDGKSTTLHLTGIIGSLRWWFEAIVRGMGGSACDPSKHSCLYDLEKPNKGLCDVCHVFGATGWARRFRLVVNDKTLLKPDDSYNRQSTASRSYKNSSGRTITPTWYPNSAPLQGQVEIKIIGTDRDFPVEVIGALIQFITDWTSIGARPQMGFGVANISPRQEMHHLATYLNNHITPPIADKPLPSLREMFFTSVSAETFPRNETFNLKYDLRRLFHNNRALRHYMMGTINDERQGAKIMMSYPYEHNTTMRVWGWIPKEVTKFGSTREQVAGHIHSHLTKNYTIKYWCEFNSPRDTVCQQYTTPQKFLESLLEVER